VRATFQKATLGDAPVEGVDGPSGGTGSLGVAALAKSPIEASPPVGTAATLRTARLSVHTTLSGRV